MAQRADPIPLRFERGVDNRSRETDLPEGAVRDAVNVDISREGNVLLRRGWRKVITASSAARGLWGDHRHDYEYYRDGTALMRFDPDSMSAENIGTLPDAETDYCWLNGLIYLSTPAGCWRWDGSVLQELGLPTPPLPTLTATATGGLPGGWYQVSMTAERADGEESGADAGKLIQVADGGGIAVSNIPTASGISTFRLYLSGANGDVLHFAASVPNGTTTATLDASSEHGPALETMHFQPLPPGRFIQSVGGRLYVADGDVLYCSAPLRYGLHDPREDWFMLPGTIRMLAEAPDGLYVGLDRQTLFLAMSDPTDAVLRVVDRRGVVPGSLVMAPPETLTDQSPDAGASHRPVWMDTDGAQVIGYSGGLIRRVTSSAITDTDYRRAAAAYLEQRGMKQVLTILRSTTGGTSSALASDKVTSTITRAS